MNPELLEELRRKSAEFGFASEELRLVDQSERAEGASDGE